MNIVTKNDRSIAVIDRAQKISCTQDALDLMADAWSQE